MTAVARADKHEESSRDTNGGDTPPAQSHGIPARAGDRPYIPAGALQLWAKADGTSGLGATLAIDPWLPDLSTSGGMSSEAVEKMIRHAFPVRLICGDSFSACRGHYDVRELVNHPEFQRRRHVAVVEETRLVGVLDLDEARGRIDHSKPDQELAVADICKPLTAENRLCADSPLLDYLLTADKWPFRVVHTGEAIPGSGDVKILGTIDIEDLQKLPVRILLFARFAHLETRLARRLCEAKPELLEVVRTREPAASREYTDEGPERRIDRFRFGELLQEGQRTGLIHLSPDEVGFLERYRNDVAHGPRWYVTRRREVGVLVECLKKLSGLATKLDSDRVSPS